MNLSSTKDFWTPANLNVLDCWTAKLSEEKTFNGKFHVFLKQEIERIRGRREEKFDNRLLNQVSRYVEAANKRSSPTYCKPLMGTPGFRMPRIADTAFLTMVLLVFMNAGSTAAACFREVRNNLPNDNGNNLANSFRDYCNTKGIKLGDLDWVNKSTRRKMEIYGRAQGMVGGDEAVDILIFNMIKFLDITNQQADLDRVIFGAKDTLTREFPIIRNFLVFRNTSNSDKVLRMYGQFISACSDWQRTMFRLFHSNGAENPAKTETHGAVLGGQQAIYLIGPFRGLEINTIAISASSVAQPRFTGLQMGPDGHGVISASRLVFTETSARSDRDAGIGVISRNETAKVIGVGLARSLRNEVDIFRPDIRFAFKNEGLDDSNNLQIPLERTDLISAIDRFLQNSAGQSQLIRSDGRPFNPADDNQLPFSTAVELLSRPYDRGDEE